MAQHRRPEIRFTDAPRGQCRWCGEAILYDSSSKKGQLDRRRRWHPECVDAYNESDPSEARKRIRRRDRGRCGECELDTYKIRREMRKIGRGRAREIRKRGFKPGKSFWELDHIVPLIDGGGHEDDNLQTLCTPCHTRKTAEEARRRAERRRGHTNPPTTEIAVPAANSESSRSAASVAKPPPVEQDPENKSRTSWEDLLAGADATNERVRRALDGLPSSQPTGQGLR